MSVLSKASLNHTRSVTNSKRPRLKRIRRSESAPSFNSNHIFGDYKHAFAANDCMDVVVSVPSGPAPYPSPTKVVALETPPADRTACGGIAELQAKLAEVRRELFFMTTRAVKAEMELQLWKENCERHSASTKTELAEGARPGMDVRPSLDDDMESTADISSEDLVSGELSLTTASPLAVQDKDACQDSQEPTSGAAAAEVITSPLQRIAEDPNLKAGAEEHGPNQALDAELSKPSELASPLPRSVSDASLLASTVKKTRQAGIVHPRRMTDPFPGLRLKKRRGGVAKSAMKLLRMVGAADKCFSGGDLNQHPLLPTPAFGRPGVPCILMVLREAFNDAGGRTAEGAFRKSPESDECQQVQRKFESGSFALRAGRSRSTDPHIYAHLVKYWLRLLTPKLLAELPDDTVKEAARCKPSNIDQYMDGLGLQPGVRCVLNWLMDFIAEVAENEEKTRMTPEALAIVVAPNIFDIGDPFAVQYAIRCTEVLIRSSLLSRRLLAEDSDGS